MKNTLFIICSLFIILSTADYFSGTFNCTGPRVRKSWATLSISERCRIARTLVRMKHHLDSWKTGSVNDSTDASPLYNVFVNTHNWNAGSWHGTSFFLPAHKYFLWVFESALIWIAYNEGATMYPVITHADACRLALPYWAWEMDYDYDPTDNNDTLALSSLWDSRIFGSYRSGAVTDGLFTFNNWPTFLQTGYDPLNLNTPPVDNVLKRYLNDKAIPLQYDPTQLAQGIVSRTQFSDFTSWLETGPHSIPHLLFGFQMSTMFSPDDFTFFLHHCNIDRIWHIWADCHDYEKIPATELNSTQFTSVNPSSGNNPKIDPNTGNPYSVGINDTITYYWITDNTSKVFPPENWPTPYDLWGMGTEDQTGWDGIYYRYGPDLLVQLSALQQNCFPEWEWANYNATESNTFSSNNTKRNIQQLTIKINLTSIIGNTLKGIFQNIENNFIKKIEQGLSARQALEDLAQEACQIVPKLEITPYVDNWFTMNGLSASDFNRVCDSNNNNTNNIFNPLGINLFKNDFVKSKENDNHQSITELPVQSWVLIASTIVLIFAVILVMVLLIRKYRQQPPLHKA